MSTRKQKSKIMDYVDIDVEVTERIYFEDIIQDIPSGLLIEELECRDIKIQDPNNVQFLDDTKDNNRRELCRMLGLNMHISKWEVMEEIARRL